MNEVKIKAKYLSSNPCEKGLEMWFKYKGWSYPVIRSFTYPVSEAEQHKSEQASIDAKIKKIELHEISKKGVKTYTAEEELEVFFKLLDE